jgi:hypothetical protein
MSTFTLFHVVISLIAIAAGFVVLGGLLRGQRLGAWTAILLVTTIAALYLRHLEGGWRRAYVVTAITALYLNVFVLVVQLAFLGLGRASVRRFQPSRA